MKSNKILIAVLSILLTTVCLTTACEKNSPPATKTTSNSPSESATAQTQKTAKTTTKTDDIEATKDTTVSISSTASPTEIYKAAYAARQQKDIETEKKFIAKDALEFMTMMGEAEHKTIDDLLREQAEKPQASSDVTRNEKINGDQATLEYPDESGNWKTMAFVRESGSWKMTIAIGKPTIETYSSNKIIKH